MKLYHCLTPFLKTECGILFSFIAVFFEPPAIFQALKIHFLFFHIFSYGLHFMSATASSLDICSIRVRIVMSGYSHHVPYSSAEPSGIFLTRSISVSSSDVYVYALATAASIDSCSAAQTFCASMQCLLRSRSN